MLTASFLLCSAEIDCCTISCAICALCALFSSTALEATDAIDEAFGRAARGGFGVSFLGGLASLGEVTYKGPLSPRGHPHGRGKVVWTGGHALMEFVEGVPHGDDNEVHGGASHLGDGTLQDGPSLEGRVPRGRIVGS